jgi:hypothetical protein
LASRQLLERLGYPEVVRLAIADRNDVWPLPVAAASRSD